MKSALGIMTIDTQPKMAMESVILKYRKKYLELQIKYDIIKYIMILLMFLLIRYTK